MAENRIEIRVTASGAEQASKVLADIAKSGASLGSIISPAVKKAEDSLNSLGATAKRVFEIFTGFTAANLFVQGIAQTKAFTVEVAKLGLEAKVQEDAFARLSQSVGVVGDVLVAQMNKAAGGILNTSDVMIAAAKALNQSLQPEQIVRLMEIARQQSKLAGIDVADAFNQITQAIANQQPRALKQLGIVIDMDDAFKKHAATLGVEVAQLTELGKTQAIYNAVAEQTANSVKALTTEALTQSEQIQKLSAAWKQVKEDIGKVVVDAGFAVLAWLQSVAVTLPDMSQQLAQFGVIWKGVWSGAVATVEPVVRILVDVFLPTLKLAATAFGVGMNAGFSVIAGPLAYVASIIDDLARNKWPSHTRATLEANVATAEARVRLAESVTAMGNLATGTTATSAATKDLAASTAMGTNSLAGMSGQVKTLVPDLKALAAATKSAQDAMGGIASTLAALASAGPLVLLPKDDAAELLQPFLKAIEQARGKLLELKASLPDAEFRARLAAFDAGTEGLTKWAKGMADGAKAAKDAKTDADNFYKGLTDKTAAAALSVEALEFSHEKWLASLNANGALDEAKRFYEELPKKIDASVTAYESVKTPLDNAARAALAFQETLAGIQRESALVGREFDLLSAKLGAYKARILELQAIKNPTGAVLAEIDELKAKFADTQEFIKWRDAFKDVFSSIGSAISTSIQGVILGTQTMGEAWDKLWKSIVLSFVNSGIQRLLKGLTDWAWDFIGGLFGGSGGGGGGIFGTLLAGAGALLGKVFGSASKSGIGPGTGTDPTGALDDVAEAASGAATGINVMNRGISNFAAGLGVATSALGAGLGIYGLTQGGGAGRMALSAVGTTASLYGIAQSASVLAYNAGLISTALPTLGALAAQAFVAVAPTLAASTAVAIGNLLPGVATLITAALVKAGVVAGPVVGGAVATGTGVGAGMAAGAAAGAATAAAWILNPGVAFGMMLIQGGLSGMAKDAEMSARAFGESADAINAIVAKMDQVGARFTDVDTAMTAANLPATLHLLHDTLRDMANLGLIVQTSFGMSIQEGDKLTQEITQGRAKVGVVWLAALDAAHAAGLDLTAGGANTLGETLQSPFRMPEGARGFGDAFIGFSNDVAISGKLMAHTLDLTVAEMQELRGALAGLTDGTMTWATILERAANEPGSILAKAFGPERLPILTERLGLDVATGGIDPAKINALLDKGWLTATLHDAVQDIGRTLGLSIEKLAEAGIAPGAWQTLAGGNVYGGGINTDIEGLPSVAAMAELQTRLEAAGFTPGNYGKALEAFLISVDANVVNHPRWKEFTGKLQAADAAGGGLPGAGALNVATYSPQAFQGAADAIITSLNTQIAEQSKARRGTTDADAIAAIDKTLEVLSAQLKAWTEGFQHLYAIASNVQAQLPPDLAGQFRAAVLPAYDALLAAMRSGSAEVASLAAQAFTEQVNAWGAFAQSIANAIDVEAMLPDNFAARFHAEMQAEYDAIRASLVAGNATLAALQLEQFNRQVAAWQALGTLVNTIDVEVAQAAGSVDAMIRAWNVQQAQMDRTVTRAQAALTAAVASGDVEAIAGAAAALHDATMARYQAEVAMVKQIEAAIADTLEAASTLVGLVTTIAQMEIASSGSLGTMQALLGALEGMATHGATAAQRMWAVQAGLQAITAVLPGLIEKFASFSTALEWLVAGMQTAEQLRGGPGGPAAITGGVLAGAAPFLRAQQAEIDAAQGAAKLALLQQQAANFQALAAAAIAAINQWAQAAIAGARAAADEVIAGARTEADRRIDVARTEAARRQALIDAAREKALAAIDAEIQGAETAARLGQEARRAQIEALQELIAKSKEWEAAVESMGKFIQSLKVSPLGPGNPADKLRQSQDAFGKALQAYTANPTAAGLTDLQALAQTMLSLAEPIFSKPSPQFQSLAATTIKQLEAAQALAAAQVTDSAVLQAQLDQLIAMDKAATLAAQAHIEALGAQKDAITKDFDTQTKELADALEKYIGGVEKALNDYIKAVEDAFKTQKLAIEKAAKDEIDAINVALIGALKANATEQAGLIGRQLSAQEAMLRAVTRGEGNGLIDGTAYLAIRQDVAIGLLVDIRAAILAAVAPKLASGSERVTEGLYHLHDDEAVLPAPLAREFRAAGGFDRMIRSAAAGAGLYQVDAKAAKYYLYEPTTWSGPRAADLNALEEQIWMLSQVFYARPRPSGVRSRELREQEASRVNAVIAGVYGQMQAILASIPKTMAPPPGTPPPGTPPPGTPPPSMPPPGPPWLYRPRPGEVIPTAAGATMAGADYGAGGPTTIIVKLDGKTIGEATLPTVQNDARSGKMRTIILETKSK